MEVLWFVLVLSLVIAAVPLLRFLIKRLTVRRKLEQICGQKGYILRPVHRCWYLGCRRRKTVDVFLETPDAVYAIKLFGMRKRGQFLVIGGDGTYRIRHFLNFISRGATARLYWESKPKRFPDYEQEISTAKPIVPVLLLSPVCLDVHRTPVNGAKSVISDGEEVAGMKLYSFAAFVRIIT